MKQSLSTMYVFKFISKTKKPGFQKTRFSSGFVSVVGSSASDIYDCNFYMILIWKLANKHPWREDRYQHVMNMKKHGYKSPWTVRCWHTLQKAWSSSAFSPGSARLAPEDTHSQLCALVTGPPSLLTLQPRTLMGMTASPKHLWQL